MAHHREREDEGYRLIYFPDIRSIEKYGFLCAGSWSNSLESYGHFFEEKQDYLLETRRFVQIYVEDATAGVLTNFQRPQSLFSG